MGMTGLPSRVASRRESEDLPDALAPAIPTNFTSYGITEMEERQ